MDKKQELQLDTEEVIQAQDEQEETEKDESEESQDVEADEVEESETDESEEDKHDKADTKAEKRINKLTAINKSLQEQLQEAKEALEAAKGELSIKDQALLKEKEKFESGFGTVWLMPGTKKPMYELTDDEFDQMIDLCLENPDPEEGKRLLAEIRAQRRQGRPLAKKQEEIDLGEQQLWEYEWGIITRALLDKETGNPELEKHIDKLKAKIVPIFQKRKEDSEMTIRYRQLTEGGVDAKMKYLSSLMKELNLYKLIQADPEIPSTTSKGKKAVATSKEKTFTRAQIKAMSLEEFEKNEKAIEKAMREGRIK